MAEINEFPSNSKFAKPEEPRKVEAVATGTRKKTSASKRAISSFFADDARQVVGYVIWEVLLPATKDLVADIVTTTIERALFGEVRSGRRSRGSSRGYTSYNRMYQRPDDAPSSRRELSRTARMMHNLDEIVLETREDAYEVIDNMERLLDQYGVVTVGDFYDLTGVSHTPIDESYGWTSLNGVVAIQTRDGYIIDLAKPKPLRSR